MLKLLIVALGGVMVRCVFTYLELKRALAAQFGGDREAYTDGKRDSSIATMCGTRANLGFWREAAASPARGSFRRLSRPSAI